MNRLLTAIAKPLSIAAMCFLLMTPTAHAQTPDASPPSREQACLKAGLTGNLLGLCRAYWEAHDCDVVRSPKNKHSCDVLAANYFRHSGGQDITSIFLSGTTTVVPPAGGAVTLPGVAVVVFPAGAFGANTSVNVRSTVDAALAAAFDEFTVMFRPANRLAYEVRVTTGTVPPASDFVRVSLVAPENFLAAVPAGHQIELFARVLNSGGEELVDTFELFAADYDPATKTITAQLPTAIFANTRNARGLYEAQITLAPTPGINRIAPAPSAGFRTSAAAMSTPGVMVNATSSCQASSIICPIAGGCRVTSPFQPARTLNGVTRPHYGTDYRAANGTSILAASDGTVERSYLSSSYGETIIVRHGNGAATLYAHLENRFVGVGDRVSRGQQIATSDNTGTSTNPHLHLEYVPNGQIILSKNRIDPDACIGALASGSITVSDNGNLADDAFEVYIDGVLIGATAIGASNTLAVSNLIPGTRNLVLKAIVAPDDIATYEISLSDGLTFTGGGTLRSGVMPQGASVSFGLVVPSR